MTRMISPLKALEQGFNRLTCVSGLTEQEDGEKLATVSFVDVKKGNGSGNVVDMDGLGFFTVRESEIDAKIREATNKPNGIDVDTLKSVRDTFRRADMPNMGVEKVNNGLKNDARIYFDTCLKSTLPEGKHEDILVALRL